MFCCFIELSVLTDEIVKLLCSWPAGNITAPVIVCGLDFCVTALTSGKWLYLTKLLL
jgi:hypothetical protein